MKSIIYALLLLTLGLSSAIARGPAVEDFVGIDIEQPDVTPKGTHALFNFEQELSDVKPEEAPVVQAVITNSELKAAAPAPESTPWAQWFGIVVILALPVVTWSLTMKHLSNRTPEEVLPDNVAIFPVKPREKTTATNDDIKKAS